MKTKVLLMMAICSLIVYSCSTERDEEIKENPTEKMKVEKLELKKLKPINQGQQNKTASDSSGVSDPIASPMNGIGVGLEPADPTDATNPDDPEIIPPGDVRPPKK